MAWYDPIYGYISGNYPIEDSKALKTACDATVKKIETAKALWTIPESGKVTFSYQTLDAIGTNLKGVSNGIDKGEKIYGAYEAYQRVKAAHKVLSDPHALRFNQKAAIPAIAVMINEFGVIAGNFPPPFNKYGPALQEIARKLAPTVKMLVPQLRESQKDIWNELGFCIAAK